MAREPSAEQSQRESLPSLRELLLSEKELSLHEIEREYRGKEAAVQ
jgi:hypothetical protein